MNKFPINSVYASLLVAVGIDPRTIDRAASISMSDSDVFIYNPEEDLIGVFNWQNVPPENRWISP